MKEKKEIINQWFILNKNPIAPVYVPVKRVSPGGSRCAVVAIPTTASRRDASGIKIWLIEIYQRAATPGRTHDRGAAFCRGRIARVETVSISKRGRSLLVLPHIRLASLLEARNLTRLPRHSGAGPSNLIAKHLGRPISAGWHARMSSRFAGKGACALCFARVY